MNKTNILPWTKSCFVCGEENPRGLNLRCHFENDKVFLNYTTRATDIGYQQIFHGGIAATLLDEVMTWAAILSMKKACVAAEFNVRLYQPIGIGEKIYAEGWATSSRRRLCLTEGTITNEKNEVVVSSTGKFLPMRSDLAELIEKDFVTPPGAIKIF